MKAKYRTGSTLFFEGNDIDYIIYCDSKEEKYELISHYHRKKNECLHFRLADKPTPIILGCYSYPYLELIEGEEIPELKDFNILEHKKEYKELAMRFINYLKDSDKQWYHIVASYFLFSQNKNKLSEEEIKIMKQVHDNGITPELKKELEEYFVCQ